ncbi:MAG TPA: hypothetical protein VLY46_06300 [Usitatibacter sp.]|nr:hypothetical protein [Usitatibacter sp.]
MKMPHRAGAALAAAFALASLAACDRGSAGAPSATPDPSAQTIDVKPAPPEGQDHNHSSVAPLQSEKPGMGYAPSQGRNATPDAQQSGEPPTQQGRSQP